MKPTKQKKHGSGENSQKVRERRLRVGRREVGIEVQGRRGRAKGRWLDSVRADLREN